MDTIASKIIDEMTSKGHRYIDSTSGTYSFEGSNLTRKLKSLGLGKDDVIVRVAARAGRYANDGYELLIFSKAVE